MQHLWHILKYKFISNSRFLSHYSLSDIIKELGSFIVYAGFAVGAFLFSQAVLSLLLEQLRIGQFLLHQFLSMIFFIFFISVNVGNILVSYSTLFKSDETTYLFTKPVEPYKIFIVKFLDNIFYSSSTLILIFLSLFLGYAHYYKLTVFQFLQIAILNLFPFIISAASLGALILLMVLRLIAYIGARQILILTVFTYLFFLIIFFKSVSPIKLVYKVLAFYPNVDQYFENLIPHYIMFLPNQWFSDSLYWIVTGNPIKSLINSLQQLSLSIILFALTILLGHKWYYRLWLKGIRFSIKKSEKIKSSSGFRNSIIYSSPSGAIFWKDALSFVRESTQVFHSIVLFILIIIFMISSAGISYVNFKDTELAWIVYLAIFMFNMLLVSTLSLRFIFPLISLEGKSFWMIKTAPLNNYYILTSKLIPAGLVVLTIAFSITLFSHVKLAPQLIVYSALSSLPVTFCLIMLNYSMGILFVKYSEKNAVRIASSKGASLSFLFSIIFMLIVVMILVLPIKEHFELALNSYYYSYTFVRRAFYEISILSLLLGLVFFFGALKSFRKDY